MQTPTTAVNTLPADKQLIVDANAVIQLYVKGQVDPVSKQKVSIETYKTAQHVVFLFTKFVAEKEARIKVSNAQKAANTFISENFLTPISKWKIGM